MPHHPQAHVSLRAVVRLGVLFALKGVSSWAGDRWLRRKYAAWFPTLPERTRWLRRVATHHARTKYFLAHPPVLGVAARYGIDRRHPWREDRAAGHIGSKSRSNQRWMVGATFAYVRHPYGELWPGITPVRMGRIAPFMH